MIKKFRKKPVTIEAIRLLNSNDSIEECIEWGNGNIFNWKISNH